MLIKIHENEISLSYVTYKITIYVVPLFLLFGVRGMENQKYFISVKDFEVMKPRLESFLIHD